MWLEVGPFPAFAAIPKFEGKENQVELCDQLHWMQCVCVCHTCICTASVCKCRSSCSTREVWLIL